MAMLAIGADRHQVHIALFVAATIGVYTVVDSHAAREVDDITYTFASFTATGVIVSLYGVATGRFRQLAAAMPVRWRRFTVTGLMSMTTYTLVLLAVQRAPVGYVAALRESSVLIAAIVGWRVLGEGGARRRSVAAAVIVGGLVLLVASG
jgi:drug/metabolite transporter (DMT)-like permease